MTIMYSLAFISGSFMIYSIQYLLVMPDYYCKVDGLNLQCDQDTYCLNMQGFVDYSNVPYQNDNWVRKFEMECNY
jgi:hypothetical protein